MRDFHRINIKEAENDFSKIGVDTNFLSNKFICGSCVLTADILHEISAKYKLPFDFLPPAIRAYVEDNIVNSENRNCYGICNFDTKKMLKDEPPFIANSLFFNHLKNKSVLRANLQSTLDGLINTQSSTHFLHTILHEWFHCIHQNLIFKKYGYEGECPVMKAKYSKPNACGLKELSQKDFMYDILLTHQDNIEKNISTYAASASLRSEIFTELMSKITAKSLNSKLQPTTNPLDYIPKNLPKSVQELIEKLLEI